MPRLRRLVVPYYLRYVLSLFQDGVTTLLLHALLSIRIPGFPSIPQDYPVLVTQFPASALLSILGFLHSFDYSRYRIPTHQLLLYGMTKHNTQCNCTSTLCRQGSE